MGQSRAKLRGFTLMETLVVLAILGGISGMATLALRAPPAIALDTAMRGVAADLRNARRVALDRGETVTAILDAAEGVVTVPALGSERQLPARVTLSATGAAFADETPSDQALTLAFYPDGSTSGADIRLRLAQREARLQVHWLTGAVQHDAP